MSDPISQSTATTQIVVRNLRCEYLQNPIGIGEMLPRLSWELQSERRGARQTAYRIVASTLLESLPAADLWDSGKVVSDQTAHVVYAGLPLVSEARVHWRVTVWDENDTEIQADESSHFEVGLLEKSEWDGCRWIGATLAGGPRSMVPAPYLRRVVTLDKPIGSARLYVTALGLYEFHINGQKIGSDVFTPGWTEYEKRVQYQTYDVTENLTNGENVLGAILGDGWYCGHVSWHHRQKYGDRPTLLAQIRVRYDDGTTETFATDADWRFAFGPILDSDLLMGEAYDARRELSGWSSPGYDETTAGVWSPCVAVLPEFKGEITASATLPVRAVEEIHATIDPSEQKQWPASKYVVDLGQNMVGRVRLTVKGAKAGQTITLRYAEVLDKLQTGKIYTANLRAARCTDYYTCKGEDAEVYEPHFTFHGFRYVEIDGLPQPPDKDTIVGVVLMSETPFTGEFECSDPMVNQLQQNIQWGQRGNFLEIPTDCPQRDERLGWTGDAQVFVRTAAFNADVAPFFTKWTQDLRDAQSAAGEYPSVVPNSEGGSDGGPAWADAGVICPWTIYLTHGDVRLLDRHYESMARFVGWQEETSRNGLRCYDGYSGWKGFGDWLALDSSGKTEGGTPKELIGTAFHAYSARLLSDAADVLGRRDEARRWRDVFERARTAFQERFVTPGGLVAGGTQTAYVLALHFDLLPQELRAGAANALVEDIKSRGHHLSTGFVGSPYLPHVLTDTGHADVALRLLFQKTWPSYLYAVTQGATTIWERWDGWTHDKGFQDVGMNSFNHYAYGAVGAWLYQRVAGIDIDPELPGYRHIVLRPLTRNADLTHARATLHSIGGRIVSDWRRDAETGTLDWEITVPANSLATAYLPTTDENDKIYESGAPIAMALGVRVLRRDDTNGETICALESGTYRFRVVPGGETS